ncbi:MAG: hypothetical protein ACRCZI_12305 [Cetobacterium sp.]
MSRKRLKDLSDTAQDGQDPSTWVNMPEKVQVVRPDDDDAIDEIFDDLPQNEACIELYRVNAQGGRPLFLEQLTPQEFTMSYVATKFGGGRYQAKGRYKGGERIPKRMPFEIEGEPFPLKRKLPSADPLASVTPTNSGPNQGGFAPVERVETGNPFADMQTAMMGMMKTMMLEMRGSEMQMLEKMKLYKELFGSGDRKDAPLDTALNMFSKGVELATMNNGGGDSGTFWLSAIRELKDPLLQIVQTVQTAISAPPRNVTPRPTATVEGAPSQPGGESEKAGPGMFGIVGMLKAALPALVNGAAKNSDPALYVDFLLDQVPESAYPTLKNWLSEPGCLDRLAMFEPGIRFQQDWWESLRVQLIEALGEEPIASGATDIQPAPSHDPSAPGEGAR